MVQITVDDVVDVFPRPLLDEERTRMAALIAQALELIELEFLRRGRDFQAEYTLSRWLQLATKQAVRAMVFQAVLVGDNIGVASVSSTTGPQSDSITYSQGIRFHWGGVGIDGSVLDLLGLAGSGLPLGRGGRVVPYGAAHAVYGAEFSERDLRG
ncbi:Gp19/Gp15/Gp42 family protein [Corynebacterium qintianiae]|uniref:Gp19/Gp15/Gp42 family protein n=1 Tax=Corynebacterium qintianiae TaxID=2709392 RepID=UPI0013EC5AF4|nr:Gp19/Gp15/Gp42 family protein [Corynebacterium qintianiae]